MMEGRSHDTLQDFLFLDCVFAGVCVCVCVRYVHVVVHCETGQEFQGAG